METKKKLSGYQNRKRKVEKEKALRKQSRSIDKFLCKPRSTTEGHHQSTLHEGDFSTLSPCASKSNNDLSDL